MISSLFGQKKHHYIIFLDCLKISTNYQKASLKTCIKCRFIFGDINISIKSHAFDETPKFHGNDLILQLSDRAKRPFDRLDGSNFGMLKKRSIAELASEPDLEPFLSH